MTGDDNSPENVDHPASLVGIKAFAEWYYKSNEGLMTGTISGTDENWENGTLGCNTEHARVAPPEVQKAVDEAIGMETFTIRISKETADFYRKAAAENGIILLAFMRSALEDYRKQIEG